MSAHIKSQSRRQLLQRIAVFSAYGTAAPLALNLAAMQSAAAQSTSGDYKALVCVFLTGGNDAYNTVVATDSDSITAYRAARAGTIALNESQLRALQPAQSLSGRQLALHPRLANLQVLFNSQREVAIMSNVGPMIEPLSKEQYVEKSRKLPTKLFSHNDQQSTWQALAPEGASRGWGGRMAELLLDNANEQAKLFAGVSAAGNSVWVAGQNTSQYQIQPSGLLRLALPTSGVEQLYGFTLPAQKVGMIAGGNGRALSQVFQQDIAKTGNRSMQAESLLRTALPSADSAPFGPGSSLQYTTDTGIRIENPLAKQLQVIARTIKASKDGLGLRRQVFFVSLSGFDTHDNQLVRHSDLMARLDHGLGYFNNVLKSLGLNDQVTTFTASDFGRTFTSNGDGTDHGWGSHHFVMGGAVKGGTVAGRLPTYSAKNTNDNNFASADQLLNGALLPSTSVEQYGAALGSWFGVPASTLKSDVFPNLAYQSAADLNLFG